MEQAEFPGSSPWGNMLNNLTGGVAKDIGVTAAVGAGALAVYRAGQAAIRATDPNGLSMAERKQYGMDVANHQAYNGIQAPPGVPAQQIDHLAATHGPDPNDYRRNPNPQPVNRAPSI